jgi:hypothetical protein
MSHRNTHYWLWFLLFGVVAGLATFTHTHTLDTESTWLLVTGVVGIVVGAKWLNEGKLTRPYDAIVGVIFTLVGLLGILETFGVNVLGQLHLGGGLVSSTSVLGLSLTLPACLIHTWLGLHSLNHATKDK